MLVVANGKVMDYCKDHGMTIVEWYRGDLLEYRGSNCVLVTDAVMTRDEYHYAKYKLMRRNVELVSIFYVDGEVSEFLAYLSDRESENRKNVYTGRPMFGCRSEEEMAVVRRIFELRDLGWSYKKIVEDPAVCYPDGRRMSTSTVQVILKNRSKYETG